MKQENKKTENKNYWNFMIVLIIFVLVGVIAAIVISEKNNQTQVIDNRGDTDSSSFLWVVFIPLWFAAVKKRKKYLNQHQHKRKY